MMEVRPLNIGIFTDTYFPQVSGVATSIQTLKNGLERQGHSVFIFTTTDPHVAKDAIEPNVFRFSSVPFVSFADRRIAIRGIFHATQVAKKLDIDIIHTQTEFSMGWIGKYVAHALKVPCVHTYHTMYEDYLHYVLNGKLLKPVHVKQFSSAFIHGMDGVVTPSVKTENVLLSYGIKTPIEVIPTGVDLARINENPRRDVRAELNLSPDIPVILTLSRIAAEKKIDHILDVLPKIVEEFPNVKFVIAGDGPDFDMLEDQVNRLTLEDYVIFAGAVEHTDVGNYYRMADLFISASDTETQGLTYVEAMAAGTPSVVFSTDYTEMLLDDPEFGQTFTTKEQMLDEILSYLRNHAGKINQAKLDKKLNDFSSDKFASTMLANYEKVIANFDELTTKDGEYLNDQN